MKKYHISYAAGRYLKAQEYCSNSAKHFGFEEVFSFGPKDIDRDFIQKNIKILQQPRGAGYWLWKPYFICKVMDMMQEGDLLAYSDSGSYYQSSPQPLIDLIQREEKGVLSFELKGLLEKEYTKRDAFVLMGLDSSEYSESSQREATFIWMIKNEFTSSLAIEYLEYAQDERIITDIPSLAANHPEFKDHRHDQSIWSLLCKKHDIPAHKLISQWGEGMKDDFPEDSYGQIAMHHRNPM